MTLLIEKLLACADLSRYIVETRQKVTDHKDGKAMHKFIRAYDDQPTIAAYKGRKRIISTISELTPRLDPETLRVCASILASSIEPGRKIGNRSQGVNMDYGPNNDGNG